MPDPPLNPSQQVERIREILVGRQMQQIEERLQRLEAAHSDQGSNLSDEFAALRTELHEDAAERAALVNELATRLSTLEESPPGDPVAMMDHPESLLAQVRDHMEDFSMTMAARIDARANELLEHFEAELRHLRHRVEGDISLLHEQKSDRHELRSRFSKLAMAAMEDPPEEPGNIPEDFVP